MAWKESGTPRRAAAGARGTLQNAQPKRPYRTPRLTFLGTVRD